MLIKNMRFFVSVTKKYNYFICASNHEGLKSTKNKGSKYIKK